MGCFECLFPAKRRPRKVQQSSMKNGQIRNEAIFQRSSLNKKGSKSLTELKEIPKETEVNGCFPPREQKKKTRRITYGGRPNGVKINRYDSKLQFKKQVTEDYTQAYLHQKVNSEMLRAGITGTTFGSVPGTKLLTTLHDDNTRYTVEEDIMGNYDFQFTNLVFEGGGNKGMAYVGALQVLEEAGITNKITRVAGSSVGAITASLFAVGFSSADLKEFMETDLRKVLVDHKCGYCSLLPNLFNGFGWNPGKKLLKWFGDTLREQTGNADITFREVLQQYGRELCVVVTNLSQMSTEYFHPKTTPNTPIRTAVRMSTALPGVFQSVRYKLNEDVTDVYVDGGLLCNYPIHAYDGWWLSMHPQDSFFKRLQPLDNYAKLFAKNERFGSWNSKTIGIMLYSHTETELMKTKLAARQGNEPPPPPNSKLYRKRRKMRINQAAATQEHQAVVAAVGRFMKELHRMHFDLDGIVSLRELRKVFEVVSNSCDVPQEKGTSQDVDVKNQSTEFTTDDQILLFGNADIEDAFRELDRDNDGEITFQELMSFVEKKGVNIQTRFLGYTRKEIKSLGDFISTLQTALAINVKRNYVEDRDIDRTIGIDTDYIEANDFYLEEMDKGFLLESGARAARAFLRHTCRLNPEYRRRGSAMLSRDFFDSPRLKKKFEFSPTSNITNSHNNNNNENVTTNQLHPPPVGGNDGFNNSLNSSFGSEKNFLTPPQVKAEIHQHHHLHSPHHLSTNLLTEEKQEFVTPQQEIFNKFSGRTTPDRRGSDVSEISRENAETAAAHIQHKPSSSSSSNSSSDEAFDDIKQRKEHTTSEKGTRKKRSTDGIKTRKRHTTGEMKIRKKLSSDEIKIQKRHTTGEIKIRKKRSTHKQQLDSVDDKGVMEAVLEMGSWSQIT